jgi:alpha-beta hydrolase superfamily lysophospholipase
LKKRIFRWAKLITIIYCLIGSILYYLQNKLMLHPVAVPADSTYHFTQPFIETNITVDAETKFNIIQFTVPDSVKKGVVLYFHGNRENIGRYALFASWFTRNGYEVWMPDYPGFGKSTGELTEQGLYEEALTVYKMARARYEPAQIVIYGKSLGTGIASQLASVRDCKHLILETPYYSLTSLVRPYLWMYPLGRLMHLKMPTHEYLPKVTASITMFHGTDDGVIPYRNARRLQKLLKPGDEFVTIPDGSHNDLGEFPVMHKKIDSLLH